MNAAHTGLVRHSNGQTYYQQPADNQWGFELVDDDQSYPGGTGLGNGTWEPVTIHTVTTQTELDQLVESRLGEAGITDHRGETYAETADRIADEHPYLADWLRLAEKRWFELQ